MKIQIFYRILFISISLIQFLNLQSCSSTTNRTFYGHSYTQNFLLNTIPLHKAGITGQRIIVGIMDTGFNLNHPSFRNLKVVDEYDFVGDDLITKDQNTQETGSDRHGTEVLAVIAGYFPQKLIGVAFGSSYVLAKCKNYQSGKLAQSSEENYSLRALDWFDRIPVDIITNSMKFQKYENADYYRCEQMDGKTAKITLAANDCVDKGSLFFSSVGNGFKNDWKIVEPPGDGFNVMAIGSVNDDGSLSDFSAAGPTIDGRIKPDLLAPGNTIYTVNSDSFTFDIIPYIYANGTSLASPMAAGVAALMLSAHPDRTPSQIMEALKKTANRSDNPQNRYGWGLIDALKAVSYFGPAFSNQPKIKMTAKGYLISTHIISADGLQPHSPAIYYRINDYKTEKTLKLEELGEENVFGVNLPVDKNTVSISFYFRAEDVKGQHSKFPRKPLGEFFKYHILQNHLSSLRMRKRCRG